MIKYLGSKRVLVPLITSTVKSLPGVRTVIDLFSGTSRVGHALKRAGFRVIANDHNAYAETLARCYVQADREDVLKDAVRLLGEFNGLNGTPGYITETYCLKSRFFQPRNGERIDAIREAIARKCLDPELEAVVLVSLMEAADRVDSTTGVQMAYLKDWAPRASNDLELRLPDILPRARHGKGEAHLGDAVESASLWTADLAYLDPPYNQHKYLGNYHIWETLVRWDRPPVYGTACKRADCRDRLSAFNSRSLIHGALRHIIKTLRVRYLLLSFNDEGYISPEEMAEILGSRGHLTIIERDFKRYVGAQIGIYNPQGIKVGTVSHLRNKEYLYLVTPEPLDRSDPPDSLPFT
jgi:adenine-specific DNA-methyltransferase